MSTQMKSVLGVSIAIVIGATGLPVMSSPAKAHNVDIRVISASASGKQPVLRHGSGGRITDHRRKTVVRDHRKKPVVRDHRTRPIVRDHRNRPIVRDHRTKPVVRDHRTRPAEVVKIQRLPCNVGSQELRRHGFHHVRNTGCDAPRYQYLATKNGKVFAVTMHAYSGSLNAEFIRFAK